MLLPLSAAPDKALQRIENCTLVPTDWADGDSFQIKMPTGETMTIRLYGADCIECHIGENTDARRLRAQRRCFGDTEAKPTAKASIELAKGFGKSAVEKTTTLLNQPFTVHTRMQMALGDGRFQRFYAFIESKDGSDLATDLVRAGLARAYGVCANGPGYRNKEEYRDTLADVELQAAKRGVGVRSATNWDKLPRVGEKLANLIIETREEAPFTKADDLMRVPGIKEKTLDPIRSYLSFDKP